MGRIICELERIYGIKNGGDRKSDSTLSNLKSQSDLREELGMSKDTYANYKKLTTLIPELQEMVDSDQITTSVASRVLARLSLYNMEQSQKKIKNSLLSSL